jgi:hypothetical protein
MGKYSRSLKDLEAEAHVRPEDMVEEQDAEPPHDYLEAEDFDRQQLLANPAGSGRLRPRNR